MPKWPARRSARSSTAPKTSPSRSRNSSPRSAGHQSHPHRQSQQPHRHRHRHRRHRPHPRGSPPSRRPHRRSLLRVLRRHRAAAHRRVSEPLRQPDLLQGLRHGRHARRLPLLAGGQRRLHAQGAVALQREHAGRARRPRRRSRHATTSIEYVREVLAARELLYAGFDKLGIPYYPSQANFVLFAAGRARHRNPRRPARTRHPRPRPQLRTPRLPSASPSAPASRPQPSSPNWRSCGEGPRQ